MSKYMTLSTHRALVDALNRRIKAASFTSETVSDDLFDKWTDEVIAEMIADGTFKVTPRQPSATTRTVPPWALAKKAGA
jgi:hypothetical protein